MRLSFDWLQDYVDLGDLSPQEVADKLTMGAFEVEEIRKVGPDISGPVKVGEIVEINPHPNADKIRLTRIKIDPDQDPMEIVCGAGNIIVGQRVPVALPGSTVINRHDGSKLPIKQTKIRGVTSNGMLCSASELGLATSEDGIFILYGMPALGADVIKLLNLFPDHILHVGTRSNRGDALCVKGLAREIAALCRRPMREPKWQLPEIDKSDAIDIQIENNEDCPYFSVRILQGLKVGPSPLRLARRLEAVGFRTINNVVDVSNYVLHELGQPLHAYDLSKLLTRQMTVRRARAGETLVTIDARGRELTDEMLIVAEGLRPLGLAGVMGGKETEVDDSTAFIALEAASFRPALIRRASRLTGLASESSLRFERGVDRDSARQASDRASALILESCGGFLGCITDSGNDRVAPVPVKLRLPRLSKLCEIEMTPAEAGELLAPLDFQTRIVSPSEIEVSVPSFRQHDVTREIDLIEEICRLWGYDRLPASMPAMTTAPDRRDPTEKISRATLSALGLSETYTSSLTALETSPNPGLDKPVVVLNPLSEDHQALRQSLINGLLKAVRYNQDRGLKDIWLYEIGHVYARTGQASQRETGVSEELKVCGLLSGLKSLSSWQEHGSDPKAAPAAGSNFYLAKGIVENLLTKLGVAASQVRFRRLNTPPSWLHPGRSCAVLLDMPNTNNESPVERRIPTEESAAERLDARLGASQLENEMAQSRPRLLIGHIGDIHPLMADKIGLRGHISGFELNLDVLRQSRLQPLFKDICSTPPVVRDLTIDLQEAIEHQDVKDSIVQAAGPKLKTLELMSLFRLESGLKSLSYRLVFQGDDQTLTNEEVEQYLSLVRESLKNNLSASFRI